MSLEAQCLLVGSPKSNIINRSERIWELNTANLRDLKVPVPIEATPSGITRLFSLVPVKAPDPMVQVYWELNTCELRVRKCMWGNRGDTLWDNNIRSI